MSSTRRPRGDAANPVQPSSVLRVVPLTEASQLEPSRRGRKKALEMPPLPQELMDAMSPLERAHFSFFVESKRQDYNIKKASDILDLHMAGLEYINYLRVQVKQLATGEILTTRWQHPGVQLRAWLDSMSTTRRARRETPGASEEDAEIERWKTHLKQMSS